MLLICMCLVPKLFMCPSILGTSFPEAENAEPTVPAVTPNAQHQMRATQTKGLTRGRKPKKGKKGAGKKRARETKRERGTRDAKPKSKATKKTTAKMSILKRPKVEAGNDVTDDANTGKAGKGKKNRKESDASAAPAPKRKPGKKCLASTPSASSGSSSTKGPKGHNQERIYTGKAWVYKVLPGQTFGCRSCRFIFGGCHHCQKEAFKGMNAAAMREMQEKGKGEDEEGLEEKEVPETRLRAKRVKGKKSSKKAKLST